MIVPFACVSSSRGLDVLASQRPLTIETPRDLDSSLPRSLTFVSSSPDDADSLFAERVCARTRRATCSSVGPPALRVSAPLPSTCCPTLTCASDRWAPRSPIPLRRPSYLPKMS
mmetsp:Transcript_737/g.1943  ORF Transcript_737/g.1943 Transcript_737/m.1943 type:complete len:114 (+) Transcript_737:205-546(+)